MTVLGWGSDGALSVRVEPAPSSRPLDEDEASEVAAAEARRRGFDVDAHDATYELTRGEGAVVYTLEDDERPLCQLVVGLRSGAVIAFEAQEGQQPTAAPGGPPSRHAPCRQTR